MRNIKPDGTRKCSDCSEQALENMTLCQKHLELRRAGNKNKRDKRRKAGLCTECGVNKPRENYTKCQDCHNKREKVRFSRVNKRKENNLCTRCGRSKNNVSCWSNNYCPGCHFKEKFGWLGTKDEAEQIINDILKKQNYKCALSGRDLKTNKYHIDHIIPRSKNINLIASPDNWQLIVEEANYFKKNKTNKELNEIALDITVESIKRGIFNIEDILSKIQST